VISFDSRISYQVTCVPLRISKKLIAISNAVLLTIAPTACSSQPAPEVQQPIAVESPATPESEPQATAVVSETEQAPTLAETPAHNTDFILERNRKN